MSFVPHEGKEFLPNDDGWCPFLVKHKWVYNPETGLTTKRLEFKHTPKFTTSQMTPFESYMISDDRRWDMMMTGFRQPPKKSKMPWRMR